MNKNEVINNYADIVIELREKISKLERTIDALQDEITERTFNPLDQYNEPPEYEDNDMSYREQCNADRSDDIQARLERGEIDEENAAELRMGA